MRLLPEAETLDIAAADAGPAAIQRAQQHLDAGDADTAKVMAVAAEASARRTGDVRTRAAALSLLAACLHRTDGYAESIDAGLEALRLWRELGDIAGESMARTTISRVLILTGDMTDALDEGLAALALAELSGDLKARRVALTAIGIVHLSLRQHAPAMEYCERAAETARMEGAVVAHGNLMDTIACVYLSMAYEAREKGDDPAALAYANSSIEWFSEALKIARRAGHRYYQGTALGNLAEALAFIGRPAEGLELMESFDVDPSSDVVSMVTQHLDTRGCICLALGRYDQAIVLFAEALRLSAGKNTAMWYCEHLSDAYERAGDLRSALDYYRRFHALFKQVASETAQRSANVAAIRLETAQAKAFALQERERAEGLYNSNLELSQRAEKLLQQSLEDPLTGLANRRFMDRLFAASGQGYTVALVDVDHFKAVNDGFSHQIGDVVLKRLAELLRRGCRTTDTAARYGGEEFALLLGDLSDSDAVAAAERVRELVEAYDWERVAPGLRITVSIGVAGSAESTSPGEALEIADRRMYDAKRGGRNQVVGPPTSEAPQPLPETQEFLRVGLG